MLTIVNTAAAYPWSPPLLADVEPVDVLVVDDEPDVRAVLERQLHAAGYTCASAASAAQATDLLADHVPALVLADVAMPGGSGLDLVETLKRAYPELAFVMMSGRDDHALTDRALHLGAFGYLIKPFTGSELRIAVANALRRRDGEASARRVIEGLTGTVFGQAAELRASREETVRRLAYAAEAYDPATGFHVERVSRRAGRIASLLGLGPDEAERIGLASALHDIGKIALPRPILRKPGPLEPHERKLIESHAEVGAGILSDSSDALLRTAATVALTHHERLDGSGYPHGLAGDAIPLAGRIAGVADVFDALTSERPYRPAFSRREALDMLEDGRGRLFDSDILDALLATLDEES